MYFRYISIFLVFTLFLSILPMRAEARVTSDYVRTANYFLLSGTTLDDKETRETLIKYDLLVIPPEAQLYNKDFFEEARRTNPDIVILAYIPTTSWNYIWSAPIYDSLWDGIKSFNWLTDGNGNRVSIWPNTEALNISTDWNHTLADWTVDEILSTGYWDGVFYDEVSAEIAWVGNVDINGDGKTDSASQADTKWKSGLVELFDYTRNRVGSDMIIVMNGSSHEDLLPYVNGRMFESYPTPWEADGSWEEITSRYLDQQEKVGYDPVFILNANSDNSGNSEDFQKVRYLLTTSLLSSGFFGYDYGTESHNQTWYYDEYDVYLGDPVQDANDILNDSNKTIMPSVWERDFENGKALVNATDEDQRIRLDGEYEKIHGIQDPETNDGRIVSSITIPAFDGLILLRPIEELLGGTFINGAFVRIFNQDGKVERTGFFSYDSITEGGNQLIQYDLDNDGDLEYVAADDSQVYIFESDGSLHTSFYPYTENYNLGINLAIGDLEQDGTVEIVTGTENGGGPQIRIFNKDGVLINPGFFAYAESFRGGVDVAIGDLNGDGWFEVIAGAGVGGGPHIRVFNKDGDVINPGFFAYDENFRGGVNVAVGDFNGDGIDDIAAAPGEGGAPEIKTFDKDGNVLSPGFFAGDANDREGLEITATDLDGDGVDEIIAIGNDVFTLTSF